MGCSRSYLNKPEAARQLLKTIEPLIDRQKWTGSSAYFLQIIGLTYTNLGDYDRASSIFAQTLAFCQTGNYLQTQGRTLTGLARLYRLPKQLISKRSKFSTGWVLNAISPKLIIKLD